MNIIDFYLRKNQQQKICMVTCYDYTSALLIAKTPVDCLLIGDSVAMTMHGFKDTISATLDMMCLHTRAVVRGAPNKFVISDMPFLSYRSSLAKNMQAAHALMQAGANALKLESAAGNIVLIRHLVESGIPIMGHLGLTPQLVHMLGGFKVQGKTEKSAKQLIKDALSLEAAGCFAIVLECVPSKLAKEITAALQIPTIGIGAGPDTDGQVLVWQDLLGLTDGKLPKFVKTYLSGQSLIAEAIQTYVTEVQSGVFPHHDHCYRSE